MNEKNMMRRLFNATDFFAQHEIVALALVGIALFVVGAL